MNDKELLTLANLLVQYHNTITKNNCSFYGESMDKALCRDTFSTIYRHTSYQDLKDIELQLIK